MMNFLYLLTLTSAHYHYRTTQDPPPPAQDQCKSVDAREPAECPNHIGPPCPPCYIGTFSDYSNGDSLTFNATQKELIRDRMQYYINYWATTYPPSKSVEGYNNFVGASGRAIIHLRLYNYTKNSTYLKIANEYMTNALNDLPRNIQYASYMFGNIGVYTIKAILENIAGNNNEVNTYLNYAINQFKSVNDAIINGASKSSDGIDMTKCGLDEGLTGMLYNGLLINSYFQKDIISQAYISNLTFYIIEQGILAGEKLKTNFLQYECPFIKDCYLWGPGHGSSGVLHIIFDAYNMYPSLLKDLFQNKKYYDAIKNTLDFYVNIQLPDGNIPTNIQGTCANDYGNDDDARVQWCHGSPGFMNVFLKGTILFQVYNNSASQIYLNAAVRTANTTFERGLLVKGTMYCHGIGGNINMFVEFHDLMKKLQSINGDFSEFNLPFLQNQAAFRAKQFVLWTLDWNNIDKTRINDTNENYSMYQGNHAIAMTYIQMLSDNWPNIRPGQPGWNFVV